MPRPRSAPFVALLTVLASVPLAAPAAALAPTATSTTTPTPTPTPAPTTTTTEERSLAPLAGLAARRVALADAVAAAKWFSGKPVEDPARERQLLDEVARRSPALGLDPRRTTAVFRDQIEANKLVQHRLLARWRAHPDERPDRAPDLEKEVRPALDRITTGLLDRLRRTRAVRAEGSCPVRLAAGYAEVAHERHLDGLHRVGTARALLSVCEPAM